MDDDKTRTDRFLSEALEALQRAAEAGDNVARHAEAVLLGKRSNGRPATDDEADLAAIAAGELLSSVAQRRAEETGA